MSGLPGAAAWRHLDARVGFEVLFPRADEHGVVFEGCSAAVEDGETWSVEYSITLDSQWATRSAHVRGRSTSGAHEVRLARDEDGWWTVDGEPAPELEGCLDVDLEASACTNAFPIRRLALDVGAAADAPAAYVRAPALAVERLEQRYERLDDDDGRTRYWYSAPRFDFEAALVYDEHGLVLDYPGIAARVL